MSKLATECTSVVIAEADPLARRVIGDHLRKFSGIKVVKEVKEARALPAAAQLLAAGVIIYGLQTSGMNLDAMAETARALPGRPVGILAFGLHSSRDAMLESLAAGAHGFLVKESGVEQLPPAITAIAAGQFVMGRDHIDELLRSRPAATTPLDGVAALTATETQVLRLIAKGHTNREISGCLCVAESTVKSHISHLLAKTGARSRAQAVALMYERGHPLC